VFENNTKTQQNKMLFVGDPHGLYEHIIEAIEKKKPSACVLVGDQCYDEPIDQLFASIDGKTAFHWIHGNHDTDNQLWFDNLFNSPWSAKNIHGRVEQLANLSIAGLGGVFRGKIWDGKKGLRYHTREAWRAVHNVKRFIQSYEQGVRKHESTIWPEDYDRLALFHADILVLHEAPTSDRHGLQALDDLAARLGVRLIVHGHHHRCYTDSLANGITVVGLGLAQVATLDLDGFARANSPDEVLSAFEFGKTAKRDGGWL